MRGLIKALFNKLGLELSRKQPAVIEEHYNDDPMAKGLENLKKLNIDIKGIIDVGAAVGSWSLLADKVWPDAEFLLFEPLVERKDELKQLVNNNKHFKYLPYAAGKSKGSIEFYVADDLDGSGIAAGVAAAKNTRKVVVTSIDAEILAHKLQGPYLVKLDTHGYEVLIIEGCEKNLENIAAFIIECYGFQIAKDSLLFWQMCEYMQQKGYRLFEIVEAYNRPKDNAFWQCDAFFISDKHQIFSSNTFS
jgi:FkbM family methyltransferase